MRNSHLWCLKNQLFLEKNQLSISERVLPLFLISILGFPPIPDSKSSSFFHSHHLDKMNYATNLFNKSSVDNRYSKIFFKFGFLFLDFRVPVDQMEIAGVFWDIENCAVPHQKSAFALVQRIRERMFTYLREVEFMVACDACKETKAVMDELNSAQVNIVHIKGTAKNAADEKLRQAIRRFADEHPPPGQIQATFIYFE